MKIIIDFSLSASPDFPQELGTLYEPVKGIN